MLNHWVMPIAELVPKQRTQFHFFNCSGLVQWGFYPNQAHDAGSFLKQPACSARMLSQPPFAVRSVSSRSIIFSIALLKLFLYYIVAYIAMVFLTSPPICTWLFLIQQNTKRGNSENQRMEKQSFNKVEKNKLNW